MDDPDPPPARRPAGLAMHDIALARALHVIGVVLWIGGVAMVTMVLLPAVRKAKTAEDRVALFEELERRFAMQARVTTLVTGASGLYIVHRLGLWPRFAAAEFWWMHAASVPRNSR